MGPTLCEGAADVGDAIGVVLILNGTSSIGSNLAMYSGAMSAFNSTLVFDGNVSFTASCR